MEKHIKNRNIFYQGGYVLYRGKKINARRNIFSGKVQIEYYNESFSYWCWTEINEEFNKDFSLLDK